MEKGLNFFKKSLKYFDDYQTGLAAVVIKEGQVIYEKYTGYANLEYQIPVEKDTIFHISSMTKQFTAMLIIQLVEEGLLNYDQELTDFYPQLFYAQGVTIKDLLNHTTGLVDPYEYYSDNNLNYYGLDNQDVLDILLKDNSLRFEPGSKFEYCNSNYILLAFIAEEICDKSYKELLKERIFTSLDMENSTVYDGLVVDNRAYGYKFDDDKYYITDYQWLTYGDGGIMSTVEDLILWDQALYSNQLISEESLEKAFRAGTPERERSIGYGFGWVVDHQYDFKVLRHAGGDDGFGSTIWRIPELELTFILLSNLDGSWRKLADIMVKTAEILKQS